MAVTKIRKISSWTLLISSIISIIVLGMFYAGGVVDPAAEIEKPIYTGLLINWTSVIVLRDNHQYSIVCGLAILDFAED